MATINVSLPSDGTTADVSDYNTPINTIVTEINGNLDNANIASGAAIAGSKIADDGITADKIDWASTGANGGIWWEELGRTTLESAGDTISVTPITARKHLRILVKVFSAGGSVTVGVRFNNDSGSNYASRRSDNGGSDATATSVTTIALVAAGTSDTWAVIDVTNISAESKLVTWNAIRIGAGAGASAAPARSEGVGLWGNTSAQITRVDVVQTDVSDFDTGSEVIVLGHN